MSVFNEFEQGYKEKSLSEHSEFLPYAKVEVYYRPINTGEQKKILKAIESRQEHLITKVYGEVLQRIVTDWGGLDESEDFPKNLYVDDQTFLLIMARGVSKGNKISFTPPCPRCEKEVKKIVIDLQKIDVKPLPNEMFSREIDIEVPGGDIYTTKLSVPIRADELEKNAFAKNHREDYSSMARTDQAFLSKAMMLDSVEKDGEVEELSFEHKTRFLDLLLSEEMEKIDEYLEELSEYGFPTTIEYDCNQCGYQTEVPVDLSDFLLRS